MACGVVLSRTSMVVAGSIAPSSRTSVAMSWSSRMPEIPARRSQRVTAWGPPMAPSSASVAWLSERVMASSISSSADNSAPARTGATALENLREGTGIFSA